MQGKKFPTWANSGRREGHGRRNGADGAGAPLASPPNPAAAPLLREAGTPPGLLREAAAVSWSLGAWPGRRCRRWRLAAGPPLREAAALVEAGQRRRCEAAGRGVQSMLYTCVMKNYKNILYVVI